MWWKKDDTAKTHRITVREIEINGVAVGEVTHFRLLDYSDTEEVFAEFRLYDRDKVPYFRLREEQDVTLTQDGHIVGRVRSGRIKQVSSTGKFGYRVTWEREKERARKEKEAAA